MMHNRISLLRLAFVVAPLTCLLLFAATELPAQDQASALAAKEKAAAAKAAERVPNNWAAALKSLDKAMRTEENQKSPARVTASYRDAIEDIPTNAPEPRGKEVSMHCFVDAFMSSTLDVNERVRRVARVSKVLT